MTTDISIIQENVFLVIQEKCIMTQIFLLYKMMYNDTNISII